MWKSKFYGAFVLNHRIVLHAIDATPARWRGDAGSSPLDRVTTSSPKNDLVHPTHWLISTQVAALTAAALVLSYVVDAAGADLLVVAESDGGGGGGLELPGWVQGHADALVAVLAATTLYHAVRPKRHGEACGDGCKDD